MCVQVGGQMVGDGKMGVKDALSGLRIPIQQGTLKGVASFCPQSYFSGSLPFYFFFFYSYSLFPWITLLNGGESSGRLACSLVHLSTVI